MENGVGSCFAGKCYALFCVLASLGMGCMVQAGALADSLRYATSLPPLGTGIILAVLTAVVLFGGAKRIGWTASVLVPVSAGLYLLAGGIAVFSFMIRYRKYWGTLWAGHLDWQIMQDRRMEAVF
ncbi:MAG: alanine:cation symporter family protein [Clostridium fessum]